MNKSTSFKRPSVRGRYRVYLRKAVGVWPVLFWLAGVAAFIVLYARGAHFGIMTGIVDTTAELIAPLENGRVRSVDVQLGQHVQAGDLLVQMDTSLVDAEIAQVEAEMVEAVNSIGNFERNTLNTFQNFENAIKDAQSAIEDLKRQASRDTALLEQLQAQQKRLDDLAARNLIGVADANTLRPQIAGLEQEVKAYPSLIEIEERRLRDAVSGRENLIESMRLREDEDIRSALQRGAEEQRAIFEATRRAILIRRQSYALRATNAGVVSRIFFHNGDIVPGGSPIVRLIPDRAVYVIGFLPEAHHLELKIGDAAMVWRQGERSVRYPARVSSIAPEIDTLPTILSPVNQQLVRGRRIIIELEGSHSLVPGETVQIRPTYAVGHPLSRLFADTRKAENPVP